MNYSLREVNAYLDAIGRIENERAASALQLDFVAAQGRGKDVKELVKKLKG